ncbi:MAG: allantoicase [Ferruginibacter sp.]
MEQINNKPAFTNLIDLAAEKIGGKTLACSDDFFAEKENLLKPGRGIFIADKYTDRGKWMDGWESRRKRTPGNDWCILKLGATGRLAGVNIDTNYFLGNHPPFASIDACYAGEDADLENLPWKEILVKSPLEPGSENFYEIEDDGMYNYLRLQIYPDGGVARLKVFGEVVKDWSNVGEDETIDLAAAVNGAKSLGCNDMFFSHMDNLLMPGRGVNMGDGWETKRNRTAGNQDWVIVKLAHEGIIEKILIDTCHFKGNYPDAFRLEGTNIGDSNVDPTAGDYNSWITLVDDQKLSADAEHTYEKEIAQKQPVTHVRLLIKPDGGISRMRLWGKISK